MQRYKEFWNNVHLEVKKIEYKQKMYVEMVKNLVFNKNNSIR